MGRPKKLHYAVNQTVVFIWSGTKKIGSITNRKLRGKKMYYDVTGEDGKLYEDLYLDDSVISAILSKETALINKIFTERNQLKLSEESEEN